jgi:uncharacterized protein YrzB (UPF0473 family)
MAKKDDKITMIPPVTAAQDESSLYEEGEDEEGEEWDDEGEDGDDTVVLVDADGNEREFVFLAVVEMDEEGSFAALTPVEEDEAADNTEVFLFHYEEDEDGAESFSPIEDEDLFARVQEAAEKMFSEMDEEEDEGAEHDHAGHSHDHGHDKDS